MRTMQVKTILLTLGLVTVGVGAARGQRAAGPDTVAADTRRWSVSPYAGVLSIADDELAGVGMEIDPPVLLGVRAAYRFHSNWGIEASYGYGSLSAKADSARMAGTASLQEVDGVLHVYDATIQYRAPRDARARLLLSAGVGGMRYSYDPFVRRNPADERVRLIDTSWANELVVPLAAGLEIDVGEPVGLRFDLRDRIQFCRAEAPPINETEDFSHCPLDDAALSNVELSGGVTIRFGGER